MDDFRLIGPDVFLPPGGLDGDYNDDGIVDGADYTVWRDNLGSGTSLPNDDTLGVGADDFDRWRMNFGATNGAGTGSLEDSPGPVPEPSSWLLLMQLALIAATTARRRCSHAGCGRGT